MELTKAHLNDGEDPSSDLDWRQLAPALERAARAIGRLDQTVRSDPLVGAWENRVRIAQAVSLTRVTGGMIDRHRLIGLLAGAPLATYLDGGIDARALRIFRQLQAEGLGPHQRGDRRDSARLLNVEVAKAFRTLRSQSVELPVLLAGGLGLRGWMLHQGPPIAGFMALSRFLAHRGCITRPWPCLAGIIRGHDRKPATLWLGAFLEALAREAEDGLEVMIKLRLSWMRWSRAIGPHRRNSRMPQVLALAAAQPAVTPAMAARALGCTTRGAALLLEELTKCGVLVEATRRRTWKLFVTDDSSSLRSHVDDLHHSVQADASIMPEFGAPAGIRAPVIKEDIELSPRREPVEIDLSRLLAETDRAIDRAATVLEGLGQRGRRARHAGAAELVG